MSEHIQIHRWSDEDGCLHREVGGQEHVVSDPMCHLPNSRGGSGGDDHSIGPETYIDVAIPCTILPAEELTDHRAGG